MGPSSDHHIRVKDAIRHPTADPIICQPSLTEDAIRLHSPLYVSEPNCGQLVLSWHGIKYIKVFGARVTLVTRQKRLLQLTISGDESSPGLDFARELFAQKHLSSLEPSELLYYLGQRKLFWIGKSFAALSTLRPPVYLINSMYRQRGAGPWASGDRQTVLSSVVHDLIRHYQSNVKQMMSQLAAHNVSLLQGDNSPGVIFLYENTLKKMEEEASEETSFFRRFSRSPRGSPSGSPSL